MTKPVFTELMTYVNTPVFDIRVWCDASRVDLVAGHDVRLRDHLHRVPSTKWLDREAYAASLRQIPEVTAFEILDRKSRCGSVTYMEWP